MGIELEFCKMITLRVNAPWYNVLLLECALKMVDGKFYVIYVLPQFLKSVMMSTVYLQMFPKTMYVHVYSLSHN